MIDISHRRLGSSEAELFVVIGSVGYMAQFQDVYLPNLHMLGGVSSRYPSIVSAKLLRL